VSPTASAALPITVVEPRRGWRFLNLRELWRYRELAYFLCWRDVKVRYKQTVLGVSWALIQPLLRMLVLSFIFGRFDMETGDVPYAIFVFSGLLPWQYFADCVNRSGQSVVANGHLITKVYFPRLAIPIASVVACGVEFGVSFVILLGMMLYYGIWPTAAFAMVIPLLAATLVAALGVGTLLSALNVAYRDFRHVIPFLIQIWMFLTPVIYPVELLGDRWGALLALNPMVGIVEAWRSAILGRPLAWERLGVSVLVAVAVLVVGSLYFRRIEARFADIV
jgi:lipopolysaccharide transport system permease protein